MPWIPLLLLDGGGQKVDHWTRLLGSLSADEGNAIAVDTNGNSYITGWTSGDLAGNTNAGGTDIVISKYDTNGNRLWTKLLGSSTLYAVDEGNGIAVDTNGNSYITGYTDGDLAGNTNAGGFDIFISKYDTNGNRLWTKLLGSLFAESGAGIAVDTNGNSYITGYTNGDLAGNTNTGLSNTFISKYDTNGNRVWTKLLGSSNSDNEGTGIAVDTNGNSYITGYTDVDLDGNTDAGLADIFISKYDTDGNRLWTKLLGSSNIDEGAGIAVDTNGNSYITGSTYGDLAGNTNSGSTDVVISKYDTNGNRLWTKLLGSLYYEDGNGIAVDTNGNSYITGSTYGNLDGNTNAGIEDIFISKYDTNGNRLWTKLLGSLLSESGAGIAVDTNGNSYITGVTEGDLDGNTNAGGNDIVIWKVENLGI